MGVFALKAPAALVYPFSITLQDAQSRSEVRAVYGGYSIAMATMLTIAAFRPGLLRVGIMLTVGAALAGMAFGRLVSAVIDERTPFIPNWFYFVGEVLTAAALLGMA